MVTRRVVSDEEEMQNLQRGAVVEAVNAAKRKQIVVQEEQALDEFLASHPEIAPVLANRIMLMTEARSYGGVVNHAILNLALIKVGKSLAITPPPAPTPSVAELALAERKRLLGLGLDELRAEVRQNSRKRVSIDEAVSPEVANMTSRADIDRLSADQLRRLMYRGGSGVARIGNIRRINEILAGKN
jgi:hypothetical protein